MDGEDYFDNANIIRVIGLISFPDMGRSWEMGKMLNPIVISHSKKGTVWRILILLGQY